MLQMYSRWSNLWIQFHRKKRFLRPKSELKGKRSKLTKGNKYYLKRVLQNTISELLLFDQNATSNNWKRRCHVQPFTFTIEPDFSVPPQDDRHPFTDVVEVQNAEEIVSFLLKRFIKSHHFSFFSVKDKLPFAA